jgi:hypothetical protein
MRDDWRKALDKRAKLATEMRLVKLGVKPTEKPRLPRNPTTAQLRAAGLLRGFHDS